MVRTYTVALQDGKLLPASERIAAECRFIGAIERALGDSDGVVATYEACMAASESQSDEIDRATAQVAVRWPPAFQLAAHAGLTGVYGLEHATFEVTVTLIRKVRFGASTPRLSALRGPGGSSRFRAPRRSSCAPCTRLAVDGSDRRLAWTSVCGPSCAQSGRCQLNRTRRSSTLSQGEMGMRIIAMALSVAVGAAHAQGAAAPGRPASGPSTVVLEDGTAIKIEDLLRRLKDVPAVPTARSERPRIGPAVGTAGSETSTQVIMPAAAADALISSQTQLINELTAKVRELEARVLKLESRGR